MSFKDVHNVLANFLERHFDELTHAVHFARRYDEVVRLVLLEHEPHRLYILRLESLPPKSNNDVALRPALPLRNPWRDPNPFASRCFLGGPEPPLAVSESSPPQRDFFSLPRLEVLDEFSLRRELLFELQTFPLGHMQTRN